MLIWFFNFLHATNNTCIFRRCRWKNSGSCNQQPEINDKEMHYFYKKKSDFVDFDILIDLDARQNEYIIKELEIKKEVV